MWERGRQILSCVDAIGKVIADYLGMKIENLGDAMGACPERGGHIEPEGGCLVCRACGYSRC